MELFVLNFINKMGVEATRRKKERNTVSQITDNIYSVILFAREKGLLNSNFTTTKHPPSLRHISPTKFFPMFKSHRHLTTHTHSHIYNRGNSMALKWLSENTKYK